MTARETIRQNVAIVARALGEDLEHVVFAGAAAATFFDLAPFVTDLRPTVDVDVIVETVSRLDYTSLHVTTVLLPPVDSAGLDDMVAGGKK